MWAAGADNVVSNGAEEDGTDCGSEGGGSRGRGGNADSNGGKMVDWWNKKRFFGL